MDQSNTDGPFMTGDFRYDTTMIPPYWQLELLVPNRAERKLDDTRLLPYPEPLGPLLLVRQVPSAEKTPPPTTWGGGRVGGRGGGRVGAG